ncbi:MAG: hypothetical protein IKL62_03020 [Clostridia bacterium]|nr:hypothetical protein [Clostridia bacterium]
MKKLLSIVLVLILCLSFAACGDDEAVSGESYIPLGIHLGMSEEELCSARGVEKRDDLFDSYGHTVYWEMSGLGDDMIEYFGDEKFDSEKHFGDEFVSAAWYHFNDEGKLYSVQIEFAYEKEAEAENAFNDVLSYYEELFGTEPEVSEDEYTVTCDFENDSVKLRLLGGGLLGRMLDILITDPGSDHPESKE